MLAGHCQIESICSVFSRLFVIVFFNAASPAAMEVTQQPRAHIAVLPTPGMGHLIPFVEFSKRLVLHHPISITFFVPVGDSLNKAQQSILAELPPTVNVVFLPAVGLEDLPAQVKLETRISLTVIRSLPVLRSSLKSLSNSTRLSALVVDVWGTDAFELAKELEIPRYIFFTSSAMSLSFVFYIPELDRSCTGEFKDLPEPVRIPGCIPVHGGDFPATVQDRKNELYKSTLARVRRYSLADGIIINSFLDLEPGALNTLMEEESGKPQIYPVGPLIQTGSATKEDDQSGCLAWLDQQPHKSVVFVSFGSGGTLSPEQLNELALGLEMSQQRFIWVVRNPNKAESNANYFSVNSNEGPLDYLPEGFLDRTKGVGLVVSSWAPQVQILSHGSTGGFLTHCGWNSTLDGVVNGVPFLAWPLYAEQRPNAAMITDGLKVGLRVKGNESTGLVERREIAEGLRSLIQGEEGKRFRERVIERKNAAAGAISSDGSSEKFLAKLALTWYSKVD